jgi:PAS domain S-box-containing protein
LLSGVVDSALDAIVATDSSLQVILFNPAAEQMFGCPAREAIGKTVYRFIETLFEDPDVQPSADEGGEERASHGPRVLWGIRREGTEFPIEASISMVETPQGAVHTIFARDITDRNRAERALAHSEAALRQAQLLASLAHIVTGPGGVFESWSDNLPGLIGVGPDAVPKTTREWLRFIHREDRELFRSSAIRSGREGTRSELEYRFRRDGNWVHLRQVVSPLPEEASDSRRPMRWFSILQDVSDQKQAELRIRSQNRMLSILSSINALIVRAIDIDELLQESCRIAVEAGQFSIAWIGLIDEETRSLRFAAGYGAQPEFYDSLRTSLPEVDLDGDSFLAVAIRKHRTMTLNDISQAPVPLEHAPAAESRSLAALPLAIGGRTVGVAV